MHSAQMRNVCVDLLYKWTARVFTNNCWWQFINTITLRMLVCCLIGVCKACLLIAYHPYGNCCYLQQPKWEFTSGFRTAQTLVDALQEPDISSEDAATGMWIEVLVSINPNSDILGPLHPMLIEWMQVFSCNL